MEDTVNGDKGESYKKKALNKDSGEKESFLIEEEDNKAEVQGDICYTKIAKINDINDFQDIIVIRVFVSAKIVY